MPNNKRNSLFKLSGLPDGFGVVVLTFGFAIALSPYLAGIEVGGLKIPAFSEGIASGLKIAGPILFLVIIALFVPVVKKRSSKDFNRIELTVESEVDVDVLIDGDYIMSVERTKGISSASSRVRVHPSSRITFRNKSAGIKKRGPIARFIDISSKKANVKIGTSPLSDIIITAEEKRKAIEEQKQEAMSLSADIAKLLSTDGDKSVRIEAVTRLGEIADKSAIPALVQALKEDPSPYVKSLAAKALGRIGDASVLPDIMEVYEDEEVRRRFSHLIEPAIEKLEFIQRNHEK